MHILSDKETEPSFMDTKTELKSFLISLFSLQLVFYALVFIYIQVISYFQLALNQHILNPRLLSSFAFDTWLIVFLLIFSLIGYSMVKKIKYLPFYLLIAYPAILVMLSLPRDVSLLQVFVFSLLSCAVVLNFSYQKIKQLEYSQV